MKNLGKLSVLAVLLAGQAIVCPDRTGTALSERYMTKGATSLTADGGAPPAPPIPLPKGETTLVADGGAPPAPPIPLTRV